MPVVKAFATDSPESCVFNALASAFGCGGTAAGVTSFVGALGLGRGPELKLKDGTMGSAKVLHPGSALGLPFLGHVTHTIPTSVGLTDTHLTTYRHTVSGTTDVVKMEWRCQGKRVLVPDDVLLHIPYLQTLSSHRTTTELGFHANVFEAAVRHIQQEIQGHDDLVDDNTLQLLDFMSVKLPLRDSCPCGMTGIFNPTEQRYLCSKCKCGDNVDVPTTLTLEDVKGSLCEHGLALFRKEDWYRVMEVVGPESSVRTFRQVMGEIDTQYGVRHVMTVQQFEEVGMAMQRAIHGDAHSSGDFPYRLHNFFCARSASPWTKTGIRYLDNGCGKCYFGNWGETPRTLDAWFELLTYNVSTSISPGQCFF